MNQLRVGDRNVAATSFDVVEASIADMRAALDSGRVTAVDLLKAYLHCIVVYDHAGNRLNSVVVMNPQARAEAAASDARRAGGQTRGPLDGIPYTRTIWWLGSREFAR